MAETKKERADSSGKSVADRLMDLRAILRDTPPDELRKLGLQNTIIAEKLEELRLLPVLFPSATQIAYWYVDGQLRGFQRHMNPNGALGGFKEITPGNKSVVKETVYIGKNVIITDTPFISGNVAIHGEITVSGNVGIWGNTILIGRMGIKDHVHIAGNTSLIGDGQKIKTLMGSKIISKDIILWGHLRIIDDMVAADNHPIIDTEDSD
jgi:carbonic anhydrase/acetyltransferase-like protein (isoleucine patch superfamily)